MIIHELRDLAILIGLCAVPPAAAGPLLYWSRPTWSGRRVRLVAASPLPVLISLFCMWLFIDASFLSSKDECGVDACGMAAMFAVIGMTYVVIAFVISHGVLWLFTRSRR